MLFYFTACTCMCSQINDDDNPGVFDHGEIEKCSYAIATTTDNRK